MKLNNSLNLHTELIYNNLSEAVIKKFVTTDKILRILSFWDYRKRPRKDLKQITNIHLVGFDRFKEKKYTSTNHRKWKMPLSNNSKNTTKKDSRNSINKITQEYHKAMILFFSFKTLSHKCRPNKTKCSRYTLNGNRSRRQM